MWFRHIGRSRVLPPWLLGSKISTDRSKGNASMCERRRLRRSIDGSAGLMRLKLLGPVLWLRRVPYYSSRNNMTCKRPFRIGHKSGLNGSEMKDAITKDFKDLLLLLPRNPTADHHTSACPDTYLTPYLWRLWYSDILQLSHSYLLSLSILRPTRSSWHMRNGHPARTSGNFWPG